MSGKFVSAGDFGANVSGDLETRTTDAFVAHQSLREGDVDKPNMHYWIADAAPAVPEGTEPDTILFLHPAFADHTCFSRQLTYFSPAHRVIICDLPGHGQARGNDFLVETPPSIVKILDAEGVAKAHIVGVDVGGVVAQDFAAHFPSRVASLTVMGAYDITDEFSRNRAESVERQNRTLMLEILSPHMFISALTETAVVTDEGKEALKAAAMEFRKNSIGSYAGIEKLGLEDVVVVAGRAAPAAEEPAAEPDEPLLSDDEVASADGDDADTSYPMFIGVGGEEGEIAKDECRAWAEREDAKFMVFEGAGRLVNLDVPDAFNSALEGFIDSIR